MVSRKGGKPGLCGGFTIWGHMGALHGPACLFRSISFQHLNPAQTPCKASASLASKLLHMSFLLPRRHLLTFWIWPSPMKFQGISVSFWIISVIASFNSLGKNVHRGRGLRGRSNGVSTPWAASLTIAYACGWEKPSLGRGEGASCPHSWSLSSVPSTSSPGLFLSLFFI